MHAMNAARATAQRPLHLSLDPGPAAAGQARSRIEAVLRAWQIPVDADVAVLLTSELVTNAVRHGGAKRVEATAEERDGAVLVEIHDDGTGIPADHGTGLGLSGMRERVEVLQWTFTLDNANPGAIVRIAIPIPPERSPETGDATSVAQSA